MSAGLHLKELLYKPEGLTCLPEIGCSLGRYFTAVGCNYKKLSFTLWICAFLSHLKGKSGISVCIIYNSLTAKDHCFKETGTLCIISVTYITFIQFFLSFRHDAFVSDFENFPIFYCNMTYAIIEISFPV